MGHGPRQSGVVKAVRDEASVRFARSGVFSFAGEYEVTVLGDDQLTERLVAVEVIAQQSERAGAGGPETRATA